LAESLVHLFTTHAEYLGLTPAEIALGTATDPGGMITNVDIPGTGFNNFDAFLGALEHGIGSSGLLASLFGSLELLFNNSF
jgi:hypothetical protein